MTRQNMEKMTVRIKSLDKSVHWSVFIFPGKRNKIKANQRFTILLGEFIN
jgi:hypothetical protein